MERSFCASVFGFVLFLVCLKYLSHLLIFSVSFSVHTRFLFLLVKCLNSFFGRSAELIVFL